MTNSILLIGVGGQGTILTSKILAAGLTEAGYDVKMSEIHGMSQRGGSVTTQIKYGERVYAPNIGLGEADVIVAFEKTEACRALPYLKDDGAIIADEHEIYSMPVLSGAAEYPHDALEELRKLSVRLTVVPAAKEAIALGNIRAQNIVLLGALVKIMKLDGVDWRRLVAEYVPAKAREINLAAFDRGAAMAKEN